MPLITFSLEQTLLSFQGCCRSDVVLLRCIITKTTGKESIKGEKDKKGTAKNIVHQII